MTSNTTDRALLQLRAANPVPDIAVDEAHQARAEHRLQALLGTDPASSTIVSLDKRRRSNLKPWFASAAAAVVLVAGGLTVPGLFKQPPQATAAEVLLAAGEASGMQEDILSTGITNQAYLKRVDTLGETTQTTEYQAPVGEEPRVHIAVEGQASPVLSQAVELPVSAAKLSQAETGQQLVNIAGGSVRGLVELLLHPSLTSAQRRLIYQALADMDVELHSTGDIANFSSGTLTFSILSKTGQLLYADNLVAAGVHTQVQATAIMSCLATANLEGPAEFSLGCADNNYVLRDIKWTNWGADTATATATAQLNKCDPFCAEGKYEQFPVTVTVGKRKQCGFNAKLYSTLEVEAADSDHKDLNRAYDIGCAR